MKQKLLLSLLFSSMISFVPASFAEEKESTPAAAAAAPKSAEKEQRGAFQKAMNAAKKDPEVAAAFKKANLLLLEKVTADNPGMSEMVAKEKQKFEKSPKKGGAAADTSTKP